MAKCPICGRTGEFVQPIRDANGLLVMEACWGREEVRKCQALLAASDPGPSFEVLPMDLLFDLPEFRQ